MLTPNDVRALKRRMNIRSTLTIRVPGSDKPMSQLYVKVLEEIAAGSIDPKSLAIAALEEKEK